MIDSALIGFYWFKSALIVCVDHCVYAIGDAHKELNKTFDSSFVDSFY